MNANIRLLIGGGLVLGSGLAVSSLKKYKTNKGAYLVKEYIFDDEKDVEYIVNQLKKLSNKYECIYISDYYDLIGQKSSFKDSDHGWSSKNISKVKIKKHKIGYVIKFPPVEVL